MKTLIALLTFSILFSSAVYAESEYISICSFTLAELGESSPEKDHRAIADIIGEFDLIVVQGVQDKGGEEHISAIVDSMNMDLPKHFSYSYFTIPGAGRGFPGNEGYAFIHHWPVFLDLRYDLCYGLKETDVPYGRKPGWVYFTAGNFDFLIVTVHLHWSDPDKRTAEVADLLRWMNAFSDRPDSEERDIIIAGNMNRFGNYSETEINNHETAFHQLFHDPGFDTNYRLLFCEHLTSPDAKEAPDDSGSTTVTNNNSMVYDQIMISSGVFHEFGDERASIGSTIGIIDFDTALEREGLEFNTIKDRISDHRPIWARFRIDRDDDDGVPVIVAEQPFPQEITITNFPNPFNPATTIEYVLPNDTHAILTIHNLSGQVVQVLKDEYQQAGTHSVVWNAADIPSGMYFCNLKAKGFTGTRKMVIVK